MAAIFSRLKFSRRWLQFSLRTMLLLMFAVGIWLGWFVDRAQRQKRAVERIEAGLMGRVVYRHQRPGTLGSMDRSSTLIFRQPVGSPSPAWLCELFGDEYFVEVVGVTRPLGDPKRVLKDSLQDLPWLEELQILVETSDDFANLQNLKRLKRLTLSNWSHDVHFECLAESRELEVLEFTGEGKHPNFEHLEQFQNLRELSIQSEPVDDEAMAHVAGLPRLERLVLECNISDEGLKPLERLGSLKKLMINARSVTDAGAESLKKLTRLNELSINGTKMTDRALESLVHLSCLRSLSLKGEHFTGEALSRLNRNLTSLTLSGLTRPISDADLKSLEGLVSLERLRIFAGLHYRRTFITDRGLQTLKQLPRLKEVCFESPYVTKAGIAELKRALPACDVQIRN